MTMITDEEFGKLFYTFEHTAFRLEMRERYNEPYEQDELRRFFAGERIDDDPAEPWLVNVRESTAAGRRFARVRVISLPPSDYSRFGLWASQFTVTAGEDIRYLTRDQADDGLPNYDYWLFDSTTVMRFHHDDDDRRTAMEIIDDPAEVVRHNHWRDVAWHHAVRRGEFVAQHQFQLD